MPSNRYAEIAPKVRALMERHDLHYVTGPILKQAYQVYKKVCVLSLPNKEPGRTRRSCGCRRASQDRQGQGRGAHQAAPPLDRLTGAVDAVVLDGRGGISQTRPVPAPGPGEVLIAPGRPGSVGPTST